MPKVEKRAQTRKREKEMKGDRGRGRERNEKRYTGKEIECIEK
jgi:hypothetical protein